MSILGQYEMSMLYLHVVEYSGISGYVDLMFEIQQKYFPSDFTLTIYSTSFKIQNTYMYMLYPLKNHDE